IEIHKVRISQILDDVEHQAGRLVPYRGSSVGAHGLHELIARARCKLGVSRSGSTWALRCVLRWIARLYTRNTKMPQRPGRLNGLRHLALTVPNLEECERFYVDVLGMEVLNRASKDLVYLTCGNDNLSLGRAQDKHGGVQAMDHYGFIVDSIEELHAWYEYLKAQGVT